MMALVNPYLWLHSNSAGGSCRGEGSCKSKHAVQFAVGQALPSSPELCRTPSFRASFNFPCPCSNGRPGWQHASLSGIEDLAGNVLVVLKAWLATC